VLPGIATDADRSNDCKSKYPDTIAVRWAHHLLALLPNRYQYTIRLYEPKMPHRWITSLLALLCHLRGSGTTLDRS
jgi:hypothetical protein